MIVIKMFANFCVLILFINTIYGSLSDLNDDILHRSKRQLLFPNSTLLQLNIGVGTPTAVKTVNVNWAIQANFQLPWNRTQVPIDILDANSGYVGFSRKKRDESYVNDAKLYHFYKYMEDMFDSFGQNGTSCVLRTLCQLGAEPLYSENNDDLLHEIASFVLNPLNDLSEDSAPESTIYIEAYKAGASQLDCLSLYQCSISFIDYFTQLH